MTQNVAACGQVYVMLAPEDREKAVAKLKLLADDEAHAELLVDMADDTFDRIRDAPPLDAVEILAALLHSIGADTTPAALAKLQARRQDG